MIANKLVKTCALDVEGRTFLVRYFESETLRGARRYSSEVSLGPGDRIILDGNTLVDLESKMARLVPATIYSRLLAARAA